MSTILQALQKSKFDQTGAYPPINNSNNNKNLKWKVAISASLVIIITLLVSLLYLLLNPRHETPSQPVINISAAPQQTNSAAAKVTFETKPLPKLVALPVKTAPTINKVDVPKAESIAQQTAQQTIAQAPEKAIEGERNVHAALDYENTPEDLKKRFELALLLSEIEENEGKEIDEITPEEGMNDGSDIRQMSSSFQNKVPFIRYDSHMYSSNIEERWIRINGEVIKEGDFDSSGQLELIEIQPLRSIFRLERQSFSVESLSDWKGY